jgi:phytoene synthase
MTMQVDNVTQHAARMLRKGSHSFHAAAALLDPERRESARLLYAWCRHLDDIADGQVLGQGQRSRACSLEDIVALREATIAAYHGAPQTEPVFEGFRRVAARHDIPLRHALALIDGFAMDARGRRYDTVDETLDYCYHVAGVVGLMMGAVLGVDDEKTLDRACDLGLAFQLTNIARDIIPDWHAGRIYVPRRWLAAAGIDPDDLVDPRHRAGVAALACRLLETAEPYYASAMAGIAALPPRAAWGVSTARAVYRAIGLRVRQAGPAAWDRRTVVPRIEKAVWALRAGAAVCAGWVKPPPMQPRPSDLWRRPT